MTGEQLKKSILQHAIEGKLVPQDPADESADALLKRIRAEKRRLFKEGKLKKYAESRIYKGEDGKWRERVAGKKQDAEIDVPFELPAGWAWARLETVCWLVNPPKAQGEELPYLDAKTLRGKGEKAYLAEGRVVDVGAKIILVDGENSGEVFDVPFRGYLGSTFRVLESAPQVDMDYLNVVLDRYKDIFRWNKIGTAIPHLNKNLFKSLLIGLPPLAEQRRIADKMERLEPLIAEYGRLEKELSKIEGELLPKLKKSILKHAIEGKLVPQDPADESADALLNRIRAEKRRLFKEGKLKKYVESRIYKGEDGRWYEKTGNKVKDITDKLPFEIPSSWTWVHLPDIAHSELGKTLDQLKNTGDFKPYLCTINIRWNKINLDKVKEAKFKKGEEEKYALQKGDLLLCEGGDVGRSAIWDSDKEMYYQNALHRVRFYCGNSPYFFIKVLELYKALKILDKASKGITIKHLVQSALHALYFPIPPLAEQRRIAERVEAIFACIDGAGAEDAGQAHGE